MGLFIKRKKSKFNNSNFFKKFLKGFFIFTVVVAIIVIGSINGLRNAKDLFGEKLSVVIEYINDINKEVKESEVVSNPVASFESFQEKANIGGFSGYENLDGVLELQQTMELTDAELGVLLSNYLQSKENLLSIREFTVLENESIKIVFLYDLREIKKVLSLAGDIIPDKMYITNTYSYTFELDENNTQKIITNKTETIINKLTKERSEEIINYFKKIDTKEDVDGLFKEFDNYVFNILNDVIIKTESTLSISLIENQGYVTFTK